MFLIPSKISLALLTILVGFNIHVDVCDNRDDSSFLDSLDVSNLIYHVTKPTYIWGHILDLVISRPTDLQVNDIHLDNSIDSDNSIILFDVSIPKWSVPKKSITFRRLKSIHIQLFKEDIVSLFNIPLLWMKVLKPATMCYVNWQTSMLSSNEKWSTWDHRQSGVQRK